MHNICETKHNNIQLDNEPNHEMERTASKGDEKCFIYWYYVLVVQDFFEDRFNANQRMQNATNKLLAYTLFSHKRKSFLQTIFFAHSLE